MRGANGAWVRGALIIVVTFAAGVAGGIGFERHVAMSHGVQTMDTTHVLYLMRQALSLDSAQTAAISAILARHQHAVDSSWRALQPGVRANLDSTLREMMGVLRPDQVVKFRAMVHVMHPGMLP